MTNGEVAELLRRMAAVCQVADKDYFRARAYQNAANAVENLTISAKDLYQQGKLEEIPGVGESLAEHLAELFKTGKVRHFEAEFKKVPLGMFGLMGIRGIGPKTAYKIAKKFKLINDKTALGQLKKLIEEGKIEKMPSFGKKSQAKIKTSMESKFSKKQGGQRMLLSDAIAASEEFIGFIRSIEGVVHAEPLGSLRRRVATVGDIDIGIATNKPDQVMAAIKKYPQVKDVIASGRGITRVKLENGQEVDLKTGTPKEWGSLLHHYTGSKLHNISLRSYALDKHLSISEHGIKNSKTQKVYQAESEEAFYKYLGLPNIPVELREGEEELDYAKKGKIPQLVELSDIKGDLHIHSDFEFDSSHDLGRSSLAEYLDRAREFSYDYIGLSDHNPKYRGTTLTHKRKVLEKRYKYIYEHYREYEKRVKTRVPKILIGLEIDVRKDGELAVDKSLADYYDYAIVSIHTNFDLGRAENTKRIIKGLQQPKAVILGHPTTRKLNQRPGIECDWEAVFDFCQKNDKILEVNATPDRLDLPDDLVKIAVRKGIKLVINTDSHDVGQLDFMKFGVWTARRGWARKADIINTYSYAALKKVLRLG